MRTIFIVLCVLVVLGIIETIIRTDGEALGWFVIIIAVVAIIDRHTPRKPPLA